MCGLFGYIGPRNPLQRCLDGLEQLEYRGYDSTGIGGIAQGALLFCKRAGKLSHLKQVLNLPPLDLAIAHTRWATHGAVTDQNAHPHLDTNNTFALIHNGIIENYAELKEMLRREGVHFSSETDSEVVVNLIAKYYQGDLIHALHQTLPLLKGMFAFLIIHKDHPNEIIATARECPLSIGINEAKTEAIISSDPNTFQGPRMDILFLHRDEIARVQKHQVEVFDAKLQVLKKPTERLEIDSKPPSKEGFPHFMLKEIFEQPATIQKALLGRIDHDNVHFDERLFNRTDFASVRQLWLLGCGTSFHAGQMATHWIEEFTDLSPAVDIASEARYRSAPFHSDALVIAISQSGETADTLAALREAKKWCKTLGICNVKNSALTREADATLFLKAGPEISVCATKAFTSQLTLLALFAVFLGRLRNSLSQEAAHHFLNELTQIPHHMQTILGRAAEIQTLAKKYAQYEDFFFMGRRHMLPTCLEAALKLKEISYVNANGYPAGELKHGPIALLNPRFPVIAFCANHQTYAKMQSNLAEVKARGAPLLVIAPETCRDSPPCADDIFYVPNTIDSLAPFSSTLFGQLFAYSIAVARGCDVDQPRNLAKSVTVE